jgi:hypothetical protein
VAGPHGLTVCDKAVIGYSEVSPVLVLVVHLRCPVGRLVFADERGRASLVCYQRKVPFKRSMGIMMGRTYLWVSHTCEGLSRGELVAPDDSVDVCRYVAGGDDRIESCSQHLRMSDREIPVHR